MKINLNGILHSSKEALFTSDNRAFRYGDGLFESVRIINGKLNLFEIHFKRLRNGCEFLKFKMPKEWTIDYFKGHILELVRVNGVSSNGRVRLSVFRGKGGYYEPSNAKPEFLIEAEECKLKGYELNKEGLKVDIYTEVEKTTNLFSTFKTNSSMIYVLASIFKKERKLDDCFLINSKNRVIEGIDSNIFLIREGKIFTPPTAEGCVAGVMREYLLEIMESEGIHCFKQPLNLEDLFTAEEIFLTNSIHGIQWVGSYKAKNFNLGIAKILSEHLNKKLVGNKK